MDDVVANICLSPAHHGELPLRHVGRGGGGGGGGDVLALHAGDSAEHHRREQRQKHE
jgi:hypothetical protein